MIPKYLALEDTTRFTLAGSPIHSTKSPETLRDDYIQEANKIITDPNILINVVSRRVKQLKYGQKPLVESLERLSYEDVALREVIEGKIDYELFDDEADKAGAG